MTNEKAIQELRWIKEGFVLNQKTRDALDMAITALQVQDKLQDIEYMCRLSGGADYFRVFAAFLEKENNSNDKVNNSTATQFNAIKTHVKGLTACRVPEDDCISRADVEQTVEDNILCYTHSDRPIDQDPDTECHMAIRTALRMLRKDLRKLPSAQPDIIVCADCKHWICHDRRCGFWNHGVKPLEWCCHAERKETR